jgi:D-3-phosphoglycerate dehydrogenase
LYKIFITTTTFSTQSEKPLALLKSNNCKVVSNNKGRKLKGGELIRELSGFDGVIAGTEEYTKIVLNELSQLKVISRLGVGLDNIDLETAKKLGITISKTKTTPAAAVVELSLNLMLDIARKITNHNNDVKNGVWNKQMGSLLQEKTLGIIGLGTIGKSLVKLVKGFNFRILAFDLFHDEKFAKEHKVNYCDIDTLLTQSDIVSIHLNLTAETKGMMNKERLYKMKPESILINTSRGEIIDENALYIALKSNQISGAGLDVFEKEPYSGPLTELNNVLLTPHIGAYAKELRIQMEIEAVENLIRGLNEE